MKVERVLLVRVSSHIDKDVQHPQHGYPPLPLKSIQARLQHEHIPVRLIDCWISPVSRQQLVQTTVDYAPDVVLVSSTSFDVEIANEFAADCRPRCPAVFVGTGQGYYLDLENYAHNNCDFDVLLLGEPEEEFFTLLEHMRSATAGDASWLQYYREQLLSGQRFLVQNPDNLAFPGYTDHEWHSYKSLYPVRLAARTVWGFLVATRGCPHNCMFCCEVVRKSSGQVLRSRSPANVADEMEHLKATGATIISFEDDSFTAPTGYIQELSRELIARGAPIPWIARARVDEVNRELLQTMHRAGCRLLSFGVESGSQRIIEMVHKQTVPQPWQQLCGQVFRWCREIGIGTNAFYVIGCPTETVAEVHQTINMALSLNSDIIQVHFFTPYPGSEAYHRYRDQIENYHATGRMFHYARPVFTLAAMTVDQLWNLRGEFYRRYLRRPGFALRHFWDHMGFYCHNPGTLRELLGIRRVM